MFRKIEVSNGRNVEESKFRKVEIRFKSLSLPFYLPTFLRFYVSTFLPFDILLSLNNELAREI